MKKRKIVAMVCLLLATGLIPALASGVSARMNGDSIEASWLVGRGSCELTLYRGGWPILQQSVSGGRGGVRIRVKDPSADYRLRLKAPDGVYTAAVVPNAKAGATATPAATKNRGDLAGEVLSLVNEERASRGLGSLRMDAELTRAACVRAGEIARKFSHTRPDGTAWSTVSARAYGENIAMGQRTAEKAVAAWMTSASHRENILRKSYGSVGICAYKADGVMYWVQLFGK